MFHDAAETCNYCGGDGRISNSLGSHKTCPGCHGTGRRSPDEGFRDVTKTKPSHYGSPAKVAEQPAAPKPTTPRTVEGLKLAAEIRTHATLSADIKAKLTREIVEYEAIHGQCTKTFAKKVRKQLRPA